MGDMTRVHNFQPKSKRRFSDPRHMNTPKITKIVAVLSVNKAMFYNDRTVVYSKFKLRNATVNYVVNPRVI